MKILFITRLFYPHVGGVEKHVLEVSKSLLKKGHQVTVLTEKYAKNLKDKETISKIKIVRFSYPHIKLLGLKFVWWQIMKNRRLIEDSDVIHIHDVFIWYLPFRLMFLNKKVYITFHGWEEIWPIPWKNIILKRLANRLSNGTITVGKYVEKHYGIKTSKIIYGASDATLLHSTVAKNRKSIVYVGRLEENTGILKFLEWLGKNPGYTVDFCGDGPLRQECEKYGTVHGFCDPTPFLKKAEYCVPGGYLAALEGLTANCKLKLFWNNTIKEDYWKMSPFYPKGPYNLKGKELTDWAKEQTWDKLVNQYLELYNSK